MFLWAVALLGLMGAPMLLSDRAWAKDYFVNTLEDKVTPVADTEDPEVGYLKDGYLSLREAMLLANASKGVKDTITFKVSGVIIVGSFGGSHGGMALPTIEDPVIIDGTSAPGYQTGQPAVELHGQNTYMSYGTGLFTLADGCEFRGLGIKNFPGSGVVLYSSNNTIEANSIQGNGGGIVSSAESANKILDNDITDNYNDGLLITGDPTVLTNGINNLVQGNRILRNASHGVEITSTGSQILDNVIADNGGNGVWISGHWVQGILVGRNFIGTDQYGTPGLGNGQNGVLVSGGSDDAIQSNVISGNGGHGVYLIDSASHNTIGG
ncbi:MAG: right-handed parallel beta-helix repeat-containing protein, partial [Nitrospinae bacterium]|nr:right-handed parallel beta-helix repeat-containing protein [Nitrospinota bacterium]